MSYQCGQLGPYPRESPGQFNDHCPPAPLFKGGRFLQAALGAGTGNPGAEAAPAGSCPGSLGLGCGQESGRHVSFQGGDSRTGLARSEAGELGWDGGVPAGPLPPS